MDEYHSNHELKFGLFDSVDSLRKNNQLTEAEIKDIRALNTSELNISESLARLLLVIEIIKNPRRAWPEGGTWVVGNSKIEDWIDEEIKECEGLYKTKLWKDMIKHGIDEGIKIWFAEKFKKNRPDRYKN